MMKTETINHLPAYSRQTYLPPFTRSITIKASGVICDSYTSNTLADYTDRTTSLTWDDGE